MYVREALLGRFSEENRHVSSNKKPLLWPSELGGCARRAMLRVKGFPMTDPFPLRVREAMWNGNIYEADTVSALVDMYGNVVDPQMRLCNSLWSGKADAVIGHGGEFPTIIEHKATSEKLWNYNDSLPKSSHLLQLWLYGELYQEFYRIKPKLILFYRSWSNWLEIEVTEINPYRLQVIGLMNDDQFEKQVDTRHLACRKLLEGCYTANTMPPYTQDVSNECFFKGEPSCTMFGHCYDEAGHRRDAAL